MILDIADLRLSVLPEVVSLSVGPGEIVGLVGESGSGKSLTALAVMGLLAPEIHASGSILLDGRQIIGASEKDMLSVRGKIAGIVFQEPMTALNPVMRAGDQVAETLLCHGIPRADARRRAEEALEQVGLPGLYDRYPHQLSGGQRQRVAIAIAIALRPRLLIADEPTTALDAVIQAQIVALLQKLVAETGMGLLLISHDLPLVEQVTHRVVSLRQGETPVAVPPRPAGAPGPVLLQGSGLVREYRHPRLRALDGVDIAVHEGESVAIARALVIEPDIIVFDEATSALDPSVKAQILKLLAEIAQRRRIAYLFVTHDLASVRLISDRVLEMTDGRLAQA